MSPAEKYKPEENLPLFRTLQLQHDADSALNPKLTAEVEISMDDVENGHYLQKAKLSFLELRENAFQDWVVRIIEMRHPTDFTRVRNTQGDHGLDGYWLDGSALACHAPRPNNFTLTRVTQKMTSDFEKAWVYLQGLKITLRKWIFAHNDTSGLATNIATHCTLIANSRQGVLAEAWCWDAIWEEIRLLRRDQIQALFGPAPSRSAVDMLTFEHIRPVLQHVAAAHPPALATISLPGVSKLECNKLSDQNRGFLRMGRIKSPLVGKYLATHASPEIPERIAQAFRERYAALKTADVHPDDIFARLWEFAGGSEFSGPQNLAAVLAILCHFFESCDIFENAPVT